MANAAPTWWGQSETRIGNTDNRFRITRGATTTGGGDT